MPTPSFDSIVILSASNWFKELRSNRYHYASRFAKKVPVFFVQPDLCYKNYRFEDTEVEKIKVLHLWKRFDNYQANLLKFALQQVSANKPVFWLYNGRFNNILLQCDSVLNVYHATEDYFSLDSYAVTNKSLIDALNQLLPQCQLLISVSDGVAASFQQKSTFNGKHITVTNGCDYKFYSIDSSAPQQLPGATPIAFYQGNIFNKLDYDLLIKLVTSMPSWKFQFCGPVLYNEKEWQQLCLLKNVQYLGVLTPEKIREFSYRATVGLIPYVEDDRIIKRGFPLKAFEYLACGLPVVSVPIEALLPFNEIIHFASGVGAFEREILRAEQLRYDSSFLLKRLQAAKQQDYDAKVNQVFTLMQELAELNIKPIQAIKSCNLASSSYWVAKNPLIKCLLLLKDRIPEQLKNLIKPSIRKALIKKWLD